MRRSVVSACLCLCMNSQHWCRFGPVPTLSASLLPTRDIHGVIRPRTVLRVVAQTSLPSKHDHTMVLLLRCRSGHSDNVLEWTALMVFAEVLFDHYPQCGL